MSKGQYARLPLFPVVGLLVTVGALWFTSAAVTPKTPTEDDLLVEARTGGYRLIDTEELRRRYGGEEKNLLLVDTRQEWEYALGHIMGAVNFPMEPTWWSRMRKKKALEGLLGPNRDRMIVFY